MLFSAPLYDVEIWPVFRADRMHSYTGPDSLTGLTLCQPVGYAPPAVLQQMVDAGLMRLEQAGDDFALRAATAGRAGRSADQFDPAVQHDRAAGMA